MSPKNLIKERAVYRIMEITDDETFLIMGDFKQQNYLLQPPYLGALEGESKNNRIILDLINASGPLVNSLHEHVM